MIVKENKSSVNNSNNDSIIRRFLRYVSLGRLCPPKITYTTKVDNNPVSKIKTDSHVDTNRPSAVEKTHQAASSPVRQERW